MKRFLVLFAAAMLIAACASPEQKAINKAVHNQMRTYPESTLQDIYKNFYQDTYGPGHVIDDAGAALTSLFDEAAISTDEPYDGILYEYTGAYGNFVRVNLYVLNNLSVAADDFALAFMRSVKVITPDDHERFRKIWPMAAKAAMRYKLPGYEEDLAVLNELVFSNKDDKSVHHSDAYNKAYHPHYRLISRGIFDSEMKNDVDGVRSSDNIYEYNFSGEN